MRLPRSPSRTRRRGVRLATLLALGAAALSAQDPNDPSPYSDAELVAEVASIQPGQPFTVALRLTMDEGWHSYWRNAGDAGSATIITWQLPAGFTAGEIQWPFPERIVDPPLVSYGYSGEVLLLVDVTPPAELTWSRAELRATADWVVCERICMPATADVQLDLPVRNRPSAPDERWGPRVAAARARLPLASAEWRLSASQTDSGYELHATPPDGWTGLLDGIYFFAIDPGVISYAALQPLSQDGGTFRLALARSEFPVGTVSRIRGVAVLPEGTAWNSSGARALSVDLPLETEPASVQGSARRITLAVALVFALLGGLLLNLMPCVFPVLSIKILGIVEHGGGDRRRVRAHGLAFAGGVIVAFWALAALLIAVRAGGAQLGWGFQLQSPPFVAFLAGLFFLFGLSLMDVFEVGTSLTRLGGLESSWGYAGSALSGVLATIVATPCIAPFMGTALGFTLTQPAAPTFLVFGTLGVGMAVPYVALSLEPRLLQRLPRPGPWMQTLRQVLAFPLFATAIWLVWVFGRQTSVSGATNLMAALLALGFAAWIVGRWNRLLVSRRAYMVTRGLATAAVGLAVWLAVRGTRDISATAAAGGWEPYSATAVAAHRAAGRAVFVDFTADWCLTCKVNERVVLETDEIRTAFEERGVALLKADWTRRDPEITAALASFGSSGVPLYVLYPAAAERSPRVLPVILTKRIVLDALGGWGADEGFDE